MQCIFFFFISSTLWFMMSYSLEDYKYGFFTASCRTIWVWFQTAAPLFKSFPFYWLVTPLSNWYWHWIPLQIYPLLELISMTGYMLLRGLYIKSHAAIFIPGITVNEFSSVIFVKKLHLQVFIGANMWFHISLKSPCVYFILGKLPYLDPTFVSWSKL